jgi:hypothetical protein
MDHTVDIIASERVSQSIDDNFCDQTEKGEKAYDINSKECK